MLVLLTLYCYVWDYKTVTSEREPMLSLPLFPAEYSVDRSRASSWPIRLLSRSTFEGFPTLLSQAAPLRAGGAGLVLLFLWMAVVWAAAVP